MVNHSVSTFLCFSIHSVASFFAVAICSCVISPMIKPSIFPASLRSISSDVAAVILNHLYELSSWPQELQNRLLGGFSAEHFGHWIITFT
jgi:hypothetical protein